MVDSYKIIESKKFMWDGKTYENEDQARGAQAEYVEAGFETEFLEEDGSYLLYTRRVVTDFTVVEGAPITVDISRGVTGQ